MIDMRCFSIGVMKNQHDAILESLGTMKEIIISLTRLPSTTYSRLSSSVSDSQNFELSSSLCPSHSSNFFQVEFRLSRKIAVIEVSLSQILTGSQNAHHRKFSKSNIDLAAKLQKQPFLASSYPLNDPRVNTAICGALLLDNYPMAL